LTQVKELTLVRLAELVSKLIAKCSRHDPDGA